MDYFDPRDYGYVADAVQGGPAPLYYYTGTDNTGPLQTAIDNAKASNLKKKVYIPNGFAMVSSLNVGDGHELEFFGEGIGRSVLIPNGKAGGKYVFDAYGAGGIVLKDFGIGRAAFHPKKPAAILRYGIGNASGNAARFERISLYGQTTQGTFVNHGAPSSLMDNCFIYTFGTNAPAMFMQNTTNWSFKHVELHELEVHLLKQNNHAYKGYGGSLVAQFNGCEDFVFTGGTIGGNGPRAVDFNGTNKRFTFINSEFYAQDPVGQAFNGVIRSNGMLEDSSFINCRMDADVYLFGGPTGCIYKQLRFFGRRNNGASNAVVYTDGPAQIIDSEIDAWGSYVNVGGGNVLGSRIWNTAGIVANNKTGTIWTDTSGQLHTGSPIIVG